MRFNISEHDRKILRDLAKLVAEYSADPVMEKNKKRWKAHNSLKSKEPMILLFPEGSWEELLPLSVMKCEGKEAREIEWGLRARIYNYEHFEDDTVIENIWTVSKHINNTGWGLEPKRIPSTETRGSWHFDPVLKESTDLKKLRHPEISVDEKGTKEEFDAVQDLFGGILDVKLVGVKHISYHLMAQYIYLRGLEEMMVDMYSEPQLLHDAMAFFEEGHHKILKQYIALNLLTVNSDNTYHNSGGNSWSDELPLPDCNPNKVRPCDMWASAEAQELAQVSPEQHAEFAIPYESRLLQPFGLTGYGCCEDLSRKLDYVFKMPHMRRISIAPWADVDICAQKLKGNFIFSWKPNPAHLVGNFDTKALKAYIAHTVNVAKENGCVLEMILKDTHTCEHHTERFDIWTKIAREVIQESL